jgi:hypothetical protein
MFFCSSVGLPVGVAVVLLGVFPERQEHLGHGDVGRAFGRGCLRRGLAGDEPLADTAFVLDPAVGRAPRAEIEVPPGQRDDGLSAGLVVAEGGELPCEAGHVRRLLSSAKR